MFVAAKQMWNHRLKNLVVLRLLDWTTMRRVGLGGDSVVFRQNLTRPVVEFDGRVQVTVSGRMKQRGWHSYSSSSHCVYR